MTFTGSLQIKGNKYYTVIFLPDKNKYEWKSTGISVLDRDGKGKAKNRKEAEKALRDRIRLHEENRTVNTNIYFVDWLNKWLKEIAPRHITESTIEGYRIYMDKHILPYFKPMRLKLDQVSVIHIQGYFDAKSVYLSASSLRKHRVVINQALTEACLKQFIPFNPCTCVRITQRDEDKFHGDAYTAEEARKLLSVVDDELKPAVFLALFTGLRRSEVLGLKWDCIDFDRNTISIRNTVVKITSVIERQATKNRESRATIPLLPPVKAYLMELKAQQEENKELLGDAYSDNGYICSWPDGKPFDPDYVTHHFSRLLKNNGLRHIRFHDLRHTCATLLLSNGVSMYQVQEYLRHADISTTINTYGHLDIRDRTNTGNRLCEILETDTSKSGY
jgi:integrase